MSASRDLTAEFLASVGARSVGGRCLPYGEGITYWPVVEVIKQLDALPSDPAAATAIRSLLRETDEATSAEEIAWAFRKLLEEQAPLVCLFDDIQWGEETFLDLIEHLALLSTGAPILVLCLARRELAERRREWPVALRLGPLPEAEVDELIPQTARSRASASGSPAPPAETPSSSPRWWRWPPKPTAEFVVPPTLQALLAARLDQLEEGERSVLERAAIEGEIFHRGAVQALAGSRPVTPSLASLVRKDLIRPDTAHIPAEDAFRFRHILIRDTAYDALPKATRAELHERFAGWLEQSSEDLVELDEIAGYHLEQAYRYRVELGPADEHARTLASRAGERLGAAGRRALARWDLSAGVGLLERAAELLEHEQAKRVPLLVDLGEALTWAHQLPRAEAVLEEALRQASATDNELLAAHALLTLQHVRSRMHPWEADLGLDEAGLERAILTFENHGDERGLAKAWSGIAVLRFEGLRERDGMAADAPRPRARRARERHAVPGSDQALPRPPPRQHVGPPFRGARRSGGQPRLGRGDREPAGPGGLARAGRPARGEGRPLRGGTRVDRGGASAVRRSRR